MKSRICNSGVVMTLVSVIALVGAAYLTPVKAEQPQTTGESQSEASKLEGTWRVQVTLRNCQTGADIRTFSSLIAFARGGTRTEITAGSSPALRSPALGTWRHTGGHTYSAMSEAYLFNPAGDWTGTQTLRQVIEIGDDPDQFNANASFEVFAPNGNLLTTGCATAIGRRFE